MNYTKWTPDKLALLFELYPDHATRDIAERLGMTSYAVSKKAQDLRLRRSAEFMSQLSAKKARSNTKRHKNPGKGETDYAKVKTGRTRYVSTCGFGGVG